MSEEEVKKEKMLRIKVSDLRSGIQKFSVGIPFTFVKLGLNVGGAMIPHLKTLDIEGIVKAMESGATGKIMEIEEMEKGHKVEIYIE